MELKGNDYYKIECDFHFENWMNESLFMLYQPMIGAGAVAFYCTCIAESVKQETIQTHNRLCSLCACSIVDIENARIKCEHVGLIRTYQKVNQNKVLYILHIDKPLDFYHFSRHDVFGRYYLKVMGSKAYDLTKKKLTTTPYSKEDCIEISSPINTSWIAEWSEENEEDYTNKVDVVEKDEKSFDMPAFLNEISVLVFPASARTKENLHLIGELGNLYGTSVSDMVVFVGKAMNMSTGVLKENQLRTSVRNSVKRSEPEMNADSLDLSPVMYLQSKQNGLPISNTDKFLLEYLSNDLKMSNRLINFLVDYCLSNNNNRLIRGVVESIATSWIRNGVVTVEDAQKCLENEKKTTTKTKVTKSRKLPSYLTEEVEKSEQDDNFDDLSERLKKRG